MNFKGLLFVILLLAVPAISGQEKNPTPQLVDTIGKSNGEDRSARFDSFFVQLQNVPDAKGYVFVYCGKTCRYGEVESHFRGIELRINGRKFDRSRITIVHGGYRETQAVDLWIGTAGTGAPAASPTINIRNVTFTKASTRIVEPYDCCGSDFVADWKTFKPSN